MKQHREGVPCLGDHTFAAAASAGAQPASISVSLSHSLGSSVDEVTGQLDLLAQCVTWGFPLSPHGFVSTLTDASGWYELLSQRDKPKRDPTWDDADGRDQTKRFFDSSSECSILFLVGQ